MNEYLYLISATCRVVSKDLHKFPYSGINKVFFFKVFFLATDSLAVPCSHTLQSRSFFMRPENRKKETKSLSLAFTNMPNVFGPEEPGKNPMQTQGENAQGGTLAVPQ